MYTKRIGETFEIHNTEVKLVVVLSCCSLVVDKCNSCFLNICIS